MVIDFWRTTDMGEPLAAHARLRSCCDPGSSRTSPT